MTLHAVRDLGPLREIARPAQQGQLPSTSGLGQGVARAKEWQGPRPGYDEVQLGKTANLDRTRYDIGKVFRL